MQAPLWGSPWEAGWTGGRDRAPGCSLPPAWNRLGVDPQPEQKAARGDQAGLVHRDVRGGSRSGSPGVLPGWLGSAPSRASRQAFPGLTRPQQEQGSAHPCPSWGRRPVRAGGAEAAGQAPPDLGDDYRVSAPQGITGPSGLRLSPRSPCLPVRIWRGAGSLGCSGGAGVGVAMEAVGPQGGPSPPGFSAIISDLSSE